MSNISSIASFVQSYAQSSAQSQVQQVAQLTMLKKAQDMQAQSILPLLDAVVQNSPKPVSSMGSIGGILDEKA